jgi:hypothetical protein
VAAGKQPETPPQEKAYDEEQATTRNEETSEQHDNEQQSQRQGEKYSFKKRSSTVISDTDSLLLAQLMWDHAASILGPRPGSIGSNEFSSEDSTAGTASPGKFEDNVDRQPMRAFTSPYEHGGEFSLDSGSNSNQEPMDDPVFDSGLDTDFDFDAESDVDIEGMSENGEESIHDDESDSGSTEGEEDYYSCSDLPNNILPAAGSLKRVRDIDDSFDVKGVEEAHAKRPNKRRSKETADANAIVDQALQTEVIEGNTTSQDELRIGEDNIPTYAPLPSTLRPNTTQETFENVASAGVSQFYAIEGRLEEESIVPVGTGNLVAPEESAKASEIEQSSTIQEIPFESTAVDTLNTIQEETETPGLTTTSESIDASQSNTTLDLTAMNKFVPSPAETESEFETIAPNEASVVKEATTSALAPEIERKMLSQEAATPTASELVDASQSNTALDPTTVDSKLDPSPDEKEDEPSATNEPASAQETANGAPELDAPKAVKGAFEVTGEMPSQEEPATEMTAQHQL